MAEIELFEDLDAVARDAAGALDRPAQPSLFDRLDWFRLIAAHCPPPGKLLVLRSRDAEGSAWLFLDVRHPLAEGYANFPTLRFDVIGRRDAALLTAIAAALRDGGVAEVDLAPLEDPEPLVLAFRNAGWTTLVTPFAVNWRADTEGLGFNAYWAKRPAELRDTVERRTRAAGLDVMVHDRFDPAIWVEHEAVYRAGGKPEQGSLPLLRALAEQEGAAGTLRLGIARKDGVPVAAQLWLVEKGEAAIHKLAHAEAAKELSPGTILSAAMFRHVLDRDRVQGIDHGIGDEACKADWMDRRRTLWQLRAFNPRTLKGLFRAGMARLAARRRSR